MKKIYLAFLFAPLSLFSCKGAEIDLPNSPFDDPYIRIGMNSEYETDGTPLSQEEYSKLRNSLSDNTIDYEVSSFTREEEKRDLKYAYFGSESSVISQCSLLSRKENLNRYQNRVTINEDITNQQIQLANSGILKATSTLNDYIFDTKYIEPYDNKYEERIRQQNNNESPVVIQAKLPTDYDPTKELNKVFSLTPLVRINAHFIETEIRSETYNFKLLGDNNKAVYGQIKNSDKFLIKEGYSLFAPYSTTVGRTYKAVDNFFYEGVLEKKEVNKKEIYRFTNFRFYHELLILSESYDGEGVPVLYLEKPVLIEFSEVKYHINYDTLSPYTGNIPDITQ